MLVCSFGHWARRLAVSFCTGTGTGNFDEAFFGKDPKIPDHFVISTAIVRYSTVRQFVLFLFVFCMDVCIFCVNIPRVLFHLNSRC
jgi:hypothetical protein